MVIAYLLMGFAFYLWSILRCPIAFSMRVNIVLMIIYTIFYPFILLFAAIARCKEIMK